MAALASVSVPEDEVFKCSRCRRLEKFAIAFGRYCFTICAAVSAAQPFRSKIIFDWFFNNYVTIINNWLLARVRPRPYAGRVCIFLSFAPLHVRCTFQHMYVYVYMYVMLFSFFFSFSIYFFLFSRAHFRESAAKCLQY